MEVKNRHVKDFINYYSKLKVAPEYAVLIKGPWGCGKSHLVQQCMNELDSGDNPVKFLYVSLYGVASFEDIETKFFQQLCPVLSSKKMVLAGRFAKGLLKGALKIDLDNDGKPDGSMSIGVPDIKLQNYMTDTRNYVLVFDDLERCSMDLKLILGYINYFVEKDGYKVILIADEEKLINVTAEGNDVSRFEIIKEKLIGKTLTVEADIVSVIDLFLDEVITDVDLKVILMDSKNYIIRDFGNSAYGNLRSLRNIFLEFECLWKVLDKDVKEKSELILHLLRLFLILSIEVYSAALRPDEIGYFIESDAVVARAKKIIKQEEKSDKYKAVRDKYDIVFFETIVSVKEWEAYFSNGFFNVKKINASLKMSRYFTNENTPDWIKLWNLYDLDNDQFEEIYLSVRKSFENFEYLEPGEIKHVLGLWLNFSRKELIKQTVKESLDEAISYIDEVFTDSKVSVNETSLEQINGFSSYANLVYLDVDSDEFKKMSEHLNNKIEEAQAEALAGRVEEVIDAIRSDPSQLYTLLCHSNYQNSPFSSRPILQHIPPSDFIDLMKEVSNNSKRVVADALFTRYKHQSMNTPLLPERPWLEEVISALNVTISGYDKVKPSTILFEYMRTKLDKALVSLRGSQQ